MAANLPRLASLAAAILWLLSLALPAFSFRFDGEIDQVLMGYQVLASGYFHLLTLEFSWLANFVFWFVTWTLWSLPSRPRWSKVGAITLLLLTAQTAQIFIFWQFYQQPMAFVGFYLWILANGFLAIAALLHARRMNNLQPNLQERVGH